MEKMSFQFDEKHSMPLDTPVDMINYPIFVSNITGGNELYN